MDDVYTLHILHTEAHTETQEGSPWSHMQLAQAYVRPQPLEGVFTPAEGLLRGTAFPNLSQPYRGRRKDT